MNKEKYQIMKSKVYMQTSLPSFSKPTLPSNDLNMIYQYQPMSMYVPYKSNVVRPQKQG